MDGRYEILLKNDHHNKERVYKVPASKFNLIIKQTIETNGLQQYTAQVQTKQPNKSAVSHSGLYFCSRRFGPLTVPEYTVALY